MNPSFRPPPPIGNDLQDVLYTEMRRGTKTLGEIATEHNVSKARLSAIKKLKEVEEELKRQVSALSESIIALISSSLMRKT